MLTILYQVIASDSFSHRSSIRDERIIGLFQTLQEAQEAALRMARPIFGKAYRAALESIPEEVRDLQGPDGIDQNLLPFMDVGEVGVSVEYLPSPQEASQYHADSIIAHFMIKEIETAF